MQARDVMYLFAASQYENALLNQTAIEVLIYLNQASVNDLRIEKYEYLPVFTSASKVGDDYVITIKETSIINYA